MHVALISKFTINHGVHIIVEQMKRYKDKKQGVEHVDKKL